MTASDKIFRNKSLERLSSPEKLDQLMWVIGPKGWWWLGTLSLLTGVAVLWSIYGRISVNANGSGVLVFPGGVTEQRSEISGSLKSLMIEEGDTVTVGQEIAKIGKPDLQLKLDQARQQLRLLRVQTGIEERKQSLEVQTERQSIAQQRQIYQGQIAKARRMAAQQHDRQITMARAQQQGYRDEIKRAEDLGQVFKENLDNAQALWDRQLITQDVYVQAKQEYLKNLDAITDLQAKIQAAEAQIGSAQEKFAESQNNVDDLRIKLKELDSQQAQLGLKTVQTDNDKQQKILSTQLEIKQLREQLDQSSTVVSHFDGKVLDINTSVGQLISPGDSLFDLLRKNKDDQLEAVLYFPISEGKKVQPGMKMTITPSIVKRQDYGGIVAEVVRVSPFPVTLAGATEMIGSEDLAKEMISRGETIEVRAKLTADPHNPSKYQWSSGKGPDLTITNGVTANAEVTVEKRSPISYLIPLFRSITGVY